MCEKKWKLHNDSLRLSWVHKSATVAAGKLHRVSLFQCYTHPLIDTCPQSKDDLTHFCTFFPLNLISITPERHRLGWRGWSAAKQELVLLHSKREGEDEGV